MSTKSNNSTPHQLAATDDQSPNEPQKTNATKAEHQQEDSVSADDIRASCINKSLVPSMSMDVWLAFDLKNLA